MTGNDQAEPGATNAATPDTGAGVPAAAGVHDTPVGAGGLDGWLRHMFRIPPLPPAPPPRVGSSPSSLGEWLNYVGTIVAAQWPFVVCLVVYYNLALGAQGVALAEREGWTSLLITRYLGIWLMATGNILTYQTIERRWISHIAHWSYRAPWIVVTAALAIAYGLAPEGPSASWLGTASLFVVALAAAVLSAVAPESVADGTARGVFAWLSESAPTYRRLTITLAVFLLPMLAGYVFTSFFTAPPVGPLSAFLMGLMALALGCQFLFVTLPARWGSPLWALVVAAAIALLIAIEPPLPDRPNPLIAVSGDATTKCSPAPGPSNADERPLAIAAEGGGMRAAYWTAVSLQLLAEQSGDDFVHRIRIMSGVSGGSVGLATWLAAQQLPPERRLPAIKKFLSEDFLTPLLLGLVFVDVPRLVLPLSTHRGDYFERAMASRWKEQNGTDFFTQRACALSYNLGKTAVYFNATDAQTGEPVVLGNRLAPAMPGADRTSRLNQVIQSRWADISVVQAIHTSARFFYVSPHPDFRAPADVVAGALGAPRGANASTDTARLAVLVDGGYFDNSATGPIIEILQRSNAVAGNEERGQTVKAAREWSVLHISNDWERGCAKTSLPSPAASGAMQAALGSSDRRACEQRSLRRFDEAKSSAAWAWATRPIEAIFAVRGAHSLQRLNELHATLLALHPPPGEVPFSEIGLPPPPSLKDEVPLVWTLSNSHRNALDEAAGTVIKELGSKLRKRSEVQK